jgi:CRP-like cAMP-binding protein
MADLSIFVDDHQTHDFPAGHRFITAGEKGDEMYIVVEGEVEVELRGKVLETIKAGGMFGELAIIDRHERSANVTSKTAVKISKIDQKRFLYLIRNHPFFAIEVMTVMADRLRHFDDLL